MSRLGRAMDPGKRMVMAIYASAELASLKLNGLNPKPRGLVHEMVVERSKDTSLDKIGALDMERLIVSGLEAERHV